MRKEAGLDFGAGDVVAGRDDHVVGARLVVKIACRIHRVGVAGDVPAVPDVVLLPCIGKVAAAGRAFYRELADHARRAGFARFIDHPRLVAGDGVTGGAAPRRFRGVRNENVDHLGGAQAVDNLDAAGLLEQLACRIGQGFAGRYAFFQAGDIEAGHQGGHLAVKRRRGEAHRGLEVLHHLEQQLGRESFHQHRRGAKAHREGEHAAQPEGEGERRRAAEYVVALGLEAGARKAVAHGDDVAVKMHRALGLAGGAGGEGDQRNVLGRGVAVAKAYGFGFEPAFQALRRGIVEVHHLFEVGTKMLTRPAAVFHFSGEVEVAQCGADFRLVYDLLEFLGA